ncbi:MAG TPA: arsinothricin resistance N-acetyltransferase ArsN1 family B [Acidobacteriaceae bacterium]|nr:arsinothricin resistance N-acetyltransferase ArsN1 family B [Acidobacteriaceae bacterium]
MIRLATTHDAARICEIYNHYVLHTAVTFEEEAVTPEEMARRIGEVVPKLPWLVWEEDGCVLGYCYAKPWRPRSAYRYSVECTVYVDIDARGQGIGSNLYRELITDLQRRGFHAAIGGILVPNDASVALHEALGFEKVAHFRQVGWKFGEWHDVGYWQLIFRAVEETGSD